MAKKKRSGKRKAGKRARKLQFEVPTFPLTVPITIGGAGSGDDWSGYVVVGAPPFDERHVVTVIWSSDLQIKKGKGKKVLLKDVVPYVQKDIPPLKFFGASKEGLVTASVKLGEQTYTAGFVARKGH